MEVINYVSKGIRYGQIWYNEQQDIRTLYTAGLDILEFKESLVPVDGLYAFRNGVISLNASAEQLFERFDKGFKYEVRRAEKEGYTCVVVDLSDTPKLKQIIAAYRDFCLRKTIHIVPDSFFYLYKDVNALRVTAVKIDNVEVQYHLYFASKYENVLLASFPNEAAANVKKSALGFANRLLHWFDIQMTLAEKKTVYNLGGIGNANDPDTMGIVKFKMEMSPQVVTYYHGIIPVSWKGRVFLKLKSGLKKAFKS